MNSKILPVPDYPALMIENDDQNAVVIADLHLGIEHSIADAGVLVPKRTWDMQEKIIGLMKQENSERLIILGDIKHTVPRTSWQEAQELPEFFRGLLKEDIVIDIVTGNHDTGLKDLLPEEITFHDASGWSYGKTALVHGHKWPAEELLDNETMVIAHNHPVVILVDKLDVRHSYQCWVRGPVAKEKLIEHYGENAKISLQEIILIPSFTEFGSGTAINEHDRNLLGPVLKNEILDFQGAKVFLLDGTNLGNTSSLLID